MKYSMIVAVVLLAGCTLAKVQVDVVSERTTLENQVLGTYNALDSEMLLAASVRAVDARGRITPPPKQSQEHKDAIMAMQVMEFHADDLHLFKQLGWVGENNQGLLTAFERDADAVPDDLKTFAQRYGDNEFAAVVDEVNRSREVIMQRVVDLNADLTASDMPQIRRLFGKLNTENALPGEKIQNEQGGWIVQP